MEKIKQITIEQAKELLRSKDVTIVDIRDPAAYNCAHIDHAILVNDENLDGFLINTPKDKPLMCYCYHGFSSQNAAAFFLQNGFQDVYSLEGGFAAWGNAFLQK